MTQRHSEVHPRQTPGIEPRGSEIYPRLLKRCMVPNPTLDYKQLCWGHVGP